MVVDYVRQPYRPKLKPEGGLPYTISSSPQFSYAVHFTVLYIYYHCSLSLVYDLREFYFLFLK